MTLKQEYLKQNMFGSFSIRFFDDKEVQEYFNEYLKDLIHTEKAGSATWGCVVARKNAAGEDDLEQLYFLTTSFLILTPISCNTDWIELPQKHYGKVVSIPLTSISSVQAQSASTIEITFIQADNPEERFQIKMFLPSDEVEYFPKRITLQQTFIFSRYFSQKHPELENDNNLKKKLYELINLRTRGQLTTKELGIEVAKMLQTN